MRPAIFDASPAPLRRFENYFSASVRSRGVVYAAQGHVEIADANDVWLLAIVQGSGGGAYDVELDSRGSTLHARCTCPYFADSIGACKHVWATLLVANAEGCVPNLARARGLSFDRDFDDDSGGGPPHAPAPSPRLPPARVRPTQHPPRVAPTWRDVLSGASQSAVPPSTEARELRFVIDADATRKTERLVVRPVERAGRHEARWWRPALVTRPFASHGSPENAVVLALLDGLSSSSVFQSWNRAVEFDVPFAPSRAVVERLCATGRAHLGDPEKPALRWEPEPYVLALEAERSREGKGFVLRAWLERGKERIASTEPALLVAGGLAFWQDRVAPFDDGGQFAWIAAERRAGPALLPEGDVDDLVDAFLRAPRAPALRLPPEVALADARVEGKPFARLSTRGHGWPGASGVAVEAGVDYDGVRAPLQSQGRAMIDRARRRLVLRDVVLEQAARERLEAVGARPLPGRRWNDDESRAAWSLAASRLDGAVRELVTAGWRVEVDGRLRRPGGDFAIDVTTGIDWLDVRVHARFDGVEAPLPELLAAVKNRRRTVVLADGSAGELSDAAMEKLRRWAGFSEVKGDALRFRKAQTALVVALLETENERDATFDQAFARARRELEAFDGVKPKGAPRTLRGSLRPYQEHGLGWFAALRRFGFGGCLADDMGLGKTVQVLAMLDARRQERPRPGPSLVVAPRSVLSNWASEAARFTPGVRVLLHDGAERLPPGEHFAGADLVLTTYGLLRQDAIALSRVEFDYVVLDEAQAIKTAGTASAKAARLLRSRHRLALTGTPLENHLGELASLIDFLNPGALGALTALSSLARGGRRVDEVTRDVLARAIRPFFLRRTKREVAPELPDRIEQTLSCELPPAQRKLYDQLHAHYRASLRRRVARDGIGKSTVHILEALLRLRQAACHPGLVDPALRRDPSAKIDALTEQLQTLHAEGQKALVFSQFTSLLAIVRDRLDERGIVYEYLDGATRDRAERVARFQSDDRCGVFLLSLKAGGVGLNLTAAEYVFLLDPWWNPAVEAQAIDRAHRIGQTRSVVAYKLLARETVEEKVAELQNQKRELADALFGEGGAALTGLTREVLEQLFA